MAPFAIAATSFVTVTCAAMAAHVTNVGEVMRARTKQFTIERAAIPGGAHRLGFREIFVVRVRRAIRIANRRLLPLLLFALPVQCLCVLTAVLTTLHAFTHGSGAGVAPATVAMRILALVPQPMTLAVVSVSMASVYEAVKRLANIVGTTSVFDGAWRRKEEEATWKHEARTQGLGRLMPRHTLRAPGDPLERVTATTPSAVPGSQLGNTVSPGALLLGALQRTLSTRWRAADVHALTKAAWTPERVDMSVELSDADRVISAALPYCGIVIVGQRVITYSLLIKTMGLVFSIALLWINSPTAA